MDDRLRYTTFNTDMGWVGVLGSEYGLLRTTLPQPSDVAAQNSLGNPATNARRSPDAFTELIVRFQLYFSGGKVDFPDDLYISAATPFQQRVWETTRLIPYGETKSYGWVAKILKQPGAARAVGQALSRNPLPIIVPCHRVLQGGGELGGFSGGLAVKTRLLALEAGEKIPK